MSKTSAINAKCNIDVQQHMHKNDKWYSTTLQDSYSLAGFNHPWQDTG